MFSWVLRDSRNIYLNKTTLLSTIFKLFPVREGFKKKNKVELDVLAKVRRSEGVSGVKPVIRSRLKMLKNYNDTL